MPSRRSRNELVLLSADDPRAVVNWLCERFGLQAVLQAVAEFRPAAQGEGAPAKRAYKKRGPKKGSKRGGARKSSKKGGAKRGRPARAQSETGNGE